MDNPAGVYTAQKKDGSVYYRSSVTICGRHISLGGFDTPEDAGRAYSEARTVFASDISIEDYSDSYILPFKKFVSIVNYRDNGIYFKTPVYIYRKYFTYHLSPDESLKFDVDDLFYYSTHSVMKRGGHLFVADFGMQVNILSRYGIREHAVCGRDYFFANGDTGDFRYGNIIIENPYHGVQHFVKNGKDFYKVKIHIKGDYVVGTYRSAEEAAVAYNKAADTLRAAGCQKSFPENYPESLDAISYSAIYNSVRISRKIRDYRA